MQTIQKRLFHLDAYKDPVALARARNFSFILLGALVGGLALVAIGAVSSLASDGDIDTFLLPPLLFVPLFFVQTYLVNRGQLRTAVWLLVLFAMASQLTGEIAVAQVSPTANALLLLVIVAVALASNPRDVLAAGLFGTASLVIGYLYHVLTHGEETVPGTEFSWLEWTSAWAATVLAVSALGVMISRSLVNVQASERSQIAARQLIFTQTSASIARQILTRLDIEVLLSETVEQLREQFEDIYHAQIFLISSDHKQAQLRASTGQVGKALMERGHALMVGSQSVIGRVTLVGEPVLVSDTSTDPTHKVNELLPNTQTELALPLRSREGIIGALDVQSLRRNAFSPKDIEVLQALADQIAIALENARLVSEAQSEAARARALSEASRITSRMNVDFGRGLHELFETVAEPGNYTHWWVGVLEDEVLRRVSAHTSAVTNSLLPERFNIKVDRNAMTEAVKSKKSIMVNNFENHPMLGTIPLEMRTMFGKHLAIPIFDSTGTNVAGALLVGRVENDSNLDEDDLEMISSLGNQVSIALENRRLFERVAAEQETLNSVVSALPTGVVVVDERGTIMIANDQARTLLGAAIRPGADLSKAYPFYRSIVDEPYPSNELPIWLALRRGKEVSAEDLMVQHPDGSRTDLISRAAPIRDASGKISAAVSTFQDITELRELERALQDSLSETTKLYEASRVVSRANDVETIGKAVVNQMLTLSPKEIYLLLKPEDNSDHVAIAAEFHENKPNNVKAIDLIAPSILIPESNQATSTTANLTFATRELTSIPGIRPDDAKRLNEAGIYALSVLPLEVRHRVFGSIIGVFGDDHEFPPDARRFLITLADQTAVALDSVFSFQQTQHALRETAKLYRASRAIAEVQNVEAALGIVAEEILSMGPDRIDIFLMRNQTEFLAPYHAYTWARDEVSGISPALPVYAGVDLDLLAVDEYFIEDIQTESGKNALAAALVASNSPYVSVASLPFRAAGQPTGRVAIGFRSRHYFPESEQQFLRMLADTTAYVIENDVLFRQTQDSLEETGILYQAIRAFANAQSNEGIIQAIIDYAADPAVDKALLCLLLTDRWDHPAAMIEVAVSWVRGDSVNLTGMRFTAEQFPSWEQLSTPEILWVNDVMQESSLDETARMGYRALDIRAFTIIPMAVAGGRPIGAIVLGSSEPRLHNEREIRIYQSLADQAAITLENNQLYEQAEYRIRQLATSSRVSRAANSILRLEELLPEVVDLIKDAFKYDHVQIFLVDERREHALLKASTGEVGQQLLAINHSLPVGSRSVIGQVTITSEPSIALDTADAQVIHKPNPYLPNTRSEMAVPLIVKGQVAGALDVQSNQPGAFTEDDVNTLRALADQLAVAIENARLFELSENSLDETRMLYQTIRALANVESAEQIMDAIVQYAMPDDIDKAMLCLLLTETWQDENAMMEVKVSWVAGDSVDLTGMRFTAEQFPSWEQLSTPEILSINDVMEDPYLDETAKMGYRALDIRSFTIIPLRVTGKPIGAILLGASHPRVHQNKEVRIYRSLADQAAITLENNQLYEQAERRARQLATSAQVSQAANSILRLEELMPQMVDLIRDAFNYDHVQIFLLDNEKANAKLRASTGEAGRQLLSINHSLPVGSRSVIGQVTSTGKPSVALDTADARVVHKPNTYLPNTRSEMAVPLIAKGEIVGALDVQSNQPGAFTEDDVRILSVLADQLAVAIENARLFEQSQKRSEEMSFLFTITSEATASHDLNEMLNRVSALLRIQMGAQAVVTYLFNELDNQLIPTAAASTLPDDILTTLAVMPRSGDHPLSRAAHNRAPILLRTLQNEQPLLETTHSAVYAPLLSGEQLVGLLALESDQPGYFDLTTLSLLQALSGSLAAVLQSVRLLHDLQEANERLREIDQLKTNFLAAMSHELRTPLNSIIGFSRVILKGIDGPITDMQKQDLQTIHDSGKHLLGLVNDILDQAKIEAGKMELAKEYFDLKAVIKGVMDSAKGLTKEKPIALHTEIEPELPAGFGDEFRTRQVLFNLVSNAAKFTNEGTVTMSAHTINENGRVMIQVSVTDTGIGIAENDFDKMFASFQQVDNSTTRAAEGTGLGLPLAKSLTELQGGRIWVVSEVGIGSTFSVTIPTEPVPEATQEETAPSANGHGAEDIIPAPPRLVMVVESDLDMINLYRRYLSKDGWVVVGVPHLAEIPNTLQNYNITAAIVDVNMEDGKGWEVLAELAARFPVLVSSMNDDFERTRKVGAAGHLVKPFVQDDLVAAVNQIAAEAKT